jgi:STE24 endopeptidase
MKHQSRYRWLLVAVVAVILLGPLPYWLSGIGQSAAGLSAEITQRADGTLISSPKAEALHSLGLPMTVERLFLYPLLLFCLQASGGALALRRWLDGRVEGMRLPLAVGRAVAWLGRRIPLAWRERVTGRDLLVILFFVLILDLALAVLYLPFNFYGGFILGHQFGLSRQAAPGWAADWVKSLLIELVTDGVLWTGFYALLRLLPRRWPIPAGAAMFLLSAVFTLLTPIIITPLFYEVRPLDDPSLRARIVALAARAGMHVDAVYVINASSKSTEVNAYFTGFSGAQRIVLYDTLLTDYTPDQIEVVLAHEMGHWYHRHVLIGLLGYGAAAWIGLFGLRWLLQRVWRPLGWSGPADVAGLPYLLAVLAVVTTLALPVQNSLSRIAERQADQFALSITHKPETFITLFEKFAVQNLSTVSAPAWEEFVFYTHPSIAERIRMAENFQKQARQQLP